MRRSLCDTCQGLLGKGRTPTTNVPGRCATVNRGHRPVTPQWCRRTLGSRPRETLQDGTASQAGCTDEATGVATTVKSLFCVVRPLLQTSSAVCGDVLDRHGRGFREPSERRQGWGVGVSCPARPVARAPWSFLLASFPPGLTSRPGATNTAS